MEEWGWGKAAVREERHPSVREGGDLYEGKVGASGVGMEVESS